MNTDITATYRVDIYEGRDIYTLLVAATSSAAAIIEAMNKAKTMELEVTAATVSEA